MNRKGFTLVELLATILILGFIAGIGAFAYTKIIGNSETRVYEAYEKTMQAEAMQYIINHPEFAPKNGTLFYYYIADIGINPINNPKNMFSGFSNTSYCILQGN